MRSNKPDDSRLTNQRAYLVGKELVRRPYRRYPPKPHWDHDHCAFCWAKFMVDDLPGVLHDGYCTTDEYYWICPRCFDDFREDFRWTLRESPA